MKRGLMTGIAGIMIASLVLLACDSNSPVGLEESLQNTPNLRVVEGAENVTMQVNKNGESSYFTVEIGNILPEAGIDEGEYSAWCVLYDTPINSNGTTYNGVRLHSADQDVALQRVETIINSKHQFMADLGADWKDIQVAIWSVLDFPKFDYGKNLAAMPSEFHSNGTPTFNTETVDQIVQMTLSAGSNATADRPKPCRIYVVETGSGTQNLIIETCDTATARMDKSKENVRWYLRTLSHVRSNNWFTYIEFPRNDKVDESPMCDDGYTTYFMFAGQHYYAGLFCAKRENNQLLFYYDFDGYYPSEIHTQIKTTTATLVTSPGQFNHKAGFRTPVQRTDVYRVDIPANTRQFYLVAHASGGFGHLE